MTWGELRKLWWLSIDVLVGRHVEIDENKGAVGTLEIKRARPRKFWTVSHRRPVQLKSRRMDCYKVTEQEVERVVSIWNWQLFQRRRRAHEGTRGESLIPVLISSAIILSSFDTSPTRCLPAGNWTRFHLLPHLSYDEDLNLFWWQFKRNYIFITFLCVFSLFKDIFVPERDQSSWPWV